jgi:hypothetical protein
MTEVHPNIHVCGEKEARERLFSFETEDGDWRVIAIGFPSSPLTDEEISLLVRFSSCLPKNSLGKLETFPPSFLSLSLSLSLPLSFEN